MLRADWLNALNSYKGVRFLHQGRSRAGVDCVGLLSCAAADLGYANEVQANLRDYQRYPDSTMFQRRIGDFLTQMPYNRLQPIRKQLKPGDVMVFWVDRRGLPRHVAVYTGVNNSGFDMMLHAYAKTPKCVVEQAIDPGFWYQRLDSLWRLPMLED